MRVFLCRLAALCLMISISPTAWAQSKRAEQTVRLQQRADLMRHEAVTRAKESGWRISGETADGQQFQLIGRDAKGRPLYVQTLNTNAAISTGADLLQQAPYNLEGTGTISGVWDGGTALPTHQEFNQTSSTRIIIGDDTPISAHATAVAGTMISAGVDAGSLGMAPMAFAECYDYLNDYAEMAPRLAASPADMAADLPITNHSYGLLHGWENGSYSGSSGWHWFGANFKEDGTGDREDAYFGRYGEDANIVDDLAYSAPYWLMFKACGNDRDDHYTGPTDGTGMFFFYDYVADDWVETTYTLATAPFADGYEAGGFDTMIDNANAKNIIAVGSVGDAVTGGLRDPGVAAMAAYSGWGPADDGRVKPDIVANGQQLRTPISSSDTAYASSASGTSFSCPNAAGTAILLLDQASQKLGGAAIRASTIKALMLGTATDMGRPGPDYEYGWGLPDGVRAADVVTSQSTNPGGFHLVEGVLDTTNGTDSFHLVWDGSNDLVVTICWTDPPSSPLPLVVDSRTPALVNDLDLRVVGPGGTFFPFILDPDNPTDNATTGDNVVDTIEQVIVPSGTTAGTYTVTVSHKSTLTNGEQWYSLIAEGQSLAAAASPSISSVLPADGVAYSMVSVELDGSDFQVGTQLELRRGAVTHAAATNEYNAPQKAFGNFDLSGLDYGLYDVVAFMPGGDEAVLVDGFEVTNDAPQILAQASCTLHEGDSVGLIITADDSNPTENVALTSGTLPSFASLVPESSDNPTTAILQLAPGYADAAATQTLTVSATDDAPSPAMSSVGIDVLVLNTPTIDSVAALDETTVVVTFDSAMSESGPGSVLNAGAYSIQTSTRATLTVTGVIPAGGNTYNVQTAAQTSGQGYMLTVTGVEDGDGNPIATDPAYGSAGFTGFTPSAVAEWWILQ
ncbi:S8 family serine peptidase [bacterium]|nr:S8 family serine peptidase [bacterium]